MLGRGEPEPGLFARQPVLGAVGGQRVLASQPHWPVTVAAAAALLDKGSRPMAPDLLFDTTASLFAHCTSRGLRCETFSSHHSFTVLVHQENTPRVRP